MKVCMTHQEQYDAIINFRKSKPLPEDQYGENHHIKPKSIYPELKDDPDNIVRLSAQEHFLAHYHLWLAYRDELKNKTWAKKMCFAFHRMKQQLLKCDDVESMSKLYEEARIEFSKNQTGQLNHTFGKHYKRSPETCKRLSESKIGSKNPMYGKTASEATRKKLSESLNGHIGYWKGKTQSKDAVEKRASKNRGKKRSMETRQKMSESQKGLRWFTNGKINSYSRECPEGFWAGMTRKK